MKLNLDFLQKLFFSIFFIGCFFCAPAQKNKKDSIIQEEILLDVEVTGKNIRYKINSSASAQMLSGKELQRINNFSVADAVKYFSGAQLKDYGGIGGLKTINIRSMGSQHTGVFFDGIKIENAQNGTVDLGKFSLDNIESIELYNGNSSELLQPAKAFFSSSSLFLKTRKPIFDSLKTSNIKASVKSGSFGLFNPSFLLEQKLKKDWTFSVNSEYIKANGKYKFRYQLPNGYDTTATRQNADVESFRAETALFKKMKFNREAFFKAYFYQSERGLPGAVVANNFFGSQRLWNKNLLLQSSYRNNPASRYQILLNAKYSNDFTRYTDPEYMLSTGKLDNKYYEQEWYFSLAQKLILKNWWQIALSTDFNFNKLNANLYQFAYPERQVYTGVLSNEFNWKKINFTASLSGQYTHDFTKINESAKDKKTLSPFVGIYVKPFGSNYFSLRAFYKESLRMPNFNDLYYTLIGNNSLEPEYTKQLNFGVTWLQKRKHFFDAFSLQSDFYFNKISNKIIAMPSSNLFRWMMINQGLVTVAGAEVNVSATKYFAQNWQLFLSANYTYQNALNKTKGEPSYHQQIPYIPLHSSTFRGSILKNNWTFNYSFIYTGKRFMLPENISANYLKPWYTSDISLSKTIANKGFQHKIGIELNNLFNQHFEVIKGFPMPGRNVKIFYQIEI